MPYLTRMGSNLVSMSPGIDAVLPLFFDLSYRYEIAHLIQLFMGISVSWDTTKMRLSVSLREKRKKLCGHVRTPACASAQADLKILILFDDILMTSCCHVHGVTFAVSAAGGQTWSDLAAWQTWQTSLLARRIIAAERTSVAQADRHLGWISISLDPFKL